MDMQFVKDFILAVAPVLLGTYIAWCEKRAKAREDKIKGLQESIANLQTVINGFQLQEQERAARQEELIAMFTELHDKVSTIDDKLSVTVEGVKDSLRNQILHSCEKYIDRGWIPMDRFQSISQMYDTYHNRMGGNGVAKKLYEDLSCLPLNHTEVDNNA